MQQSIQEPFAGNVGRKNTSSFFYMGLFILLILAEYLLFKNYILREIVQYYPQQFDQVWYLTEGYRLYENIISNGRLLQAIQHQAQMPQTLLFNTQSAIFFLFFGASRASALSINFIYFALLQWISFSTFKKISGNYLYGFIFIAILLSTNLLRYAADFRIDFISYCLYGIFCCTVLRSDVFLLRKWTFISLLTAAYLIMIRYITGCYIVGISVTLLGYYLLKRCLLTKKPEAVQAMQARIVNILIFNAGILLLFVVLFWHNYQVIHDYYIVGHVTGAEKFVRLKAALADTGLSNALWYYPVAFIQHHFPKQLLYHLMEILLIFLGLLLAAKKCFPRKKEAAQIKIDYADSVIFLLISILCPAFILTLDVSKSYIVIGIVLTPFIYLFLFSFIALTRKISLLSATFGQYLLLATTILFFLPATDHLLKLFSHVDGHNYYYNKPIYSNKEKAITKWVDDIGNYASFLHWETFLAIQSEVSDMLSAPLVPLYYERHGIMLNLNGGKMTGLMTAISKQDAIDSVNHADIFFSNLSPVVPINMYDFDRSLVPYRSLLRQLAEKRMIKLGEYFIEDRMIRVYARPDVYISGEIGNYFTNQGMWLNFPAIVAQQVSTVQLEGDADFRWLGKRQLKVYATAEISKSNNVPVKSRIIITGNHYKIICKLPEWQSNDPLIIHLNFSNFHKDGIYQIVIPIPTKKSFLLKT